VKEKLHNYESVYPSRDIVQHDPGAFWQSFQLSDGRWLEDVEDSKKYKTGEKSFPFEWNGDERDKLSGNLVDDDEAGVLFSRGPGDAGSGWNTHKGHDDREADKGRCAQGMWQGLGECGPEEHGRG